MVLSKARRSQELLEDPLAAEERAFRQKRGHLLPTTK
jgi:hypothetical protein